MDITIVTMPTGLMQPLRHLNAKLKFAILTLFFNQDDCGTTV